MATKRDTIYNFVGSESDITDYIVESIQEIADGCKWSEIDFVKREISLPSGTTKNNRCDLLLWHKDGTGTLIEVKKYKDDNYMVGAIGQVLMYAELCLIKYGNYPRIVIASDYIPTVLKSIIKSNKLPIKTMQIDGEKVTYEIVGGCHG